MTATILEFPRDDLDRKALQILRERNRPSKGGYSVEEIEWAVHTVQQWDPNHPFLRFSERCKDGNWEA